MVGLLVHVSKDWERKYRGVIYYDYYLIELQMEFYQVAERHYTQNNTPRPNKTQHTKLKTIKDKLHKMSTTRKQVKLSLQQALETYRSERR
jgi:hypothetical protein